MEEFEFKPLTDGLGFHKKKTDEDKDAQLPSLAEKETISSLPFITDSLEIKKKNLEEKVSGLPFDFSQTTSKVPSLFSSTLPRETKTQETRETVTVPKFHSPKLKSTLKNETPNNQDLKQKNLQTMEATKKETVVSNKIDVAFVEPIYSKSYSFITSIILDVIVVLGLSALFTLSLVLATGLDIITIVSQTLQDSGTQVGVAMLIYSVSQLYMILSRSFFGQTLGEWSIEQQLGTPQEQQKASYIFRLLFRNLVITLTGFFVLPTISRLFKVDVAAKISGVSLYKKES